MIYTAADAQCFITSFFCKGATNAAPSFDDCCRPVIASNDFERSFSFTGSDCSSCIGTKYYELLLYVCLIYIFFTVLGLAQSQYTFAERSTFYSLRLRLLSPATTLFLGRPRLRLLGIPGTASGKTKNTSCIFYDLLHMQYQVSM